MAMSLFLTVLATIFFYVSFKKKMHCLRFSCKSLILSFLKSIRSQSNNEMPAPTNFSVFEHGVLSFSFYKFYIFCFLVLNSIVSYVDSESEIDVFESVDKQRREEEMVCSVVFESRFSVLTASA